MGSASEGTYRTKKHFIELADYIKMANTPFTSDQLAVLASFCKAQNGAFNKERWYSYIRGECGPNGGEIKAKAAKR